MHKANKEKLLICKSVRFHCRKDEDAFFEWINKIDCIAKTSATGRELYLHICADVIHDYDLRDILGLFSRYKIDMQQLARFLTNTNKS